MHRNRLRCNQMMVVVLRLHGNMGYSFGLLQ